MQDFGNNSGGVLSGAINTVVTSIVLTDASSFPTPTGGRYFLATLIGLNGSGQETSWEVVKCTARSGNTLTVVRAQEGTVAASWGIGVRIEVRLTAGYMGLVDTHLDSKDATGGYPGLTLFKLNLRNAANTITSWFTTAATVARTWTMPDKDGTVAMTNDITDTLITGKVITNYVSGAGTVAATDTILQAVNKLNGNVLLKANIASPTFSGNVTGLGVSTGTSFNLITGLSAAVGATAGTAIAGVATTAARGDHVHPAQTTVSGNAGNVTGIVLGANGGTGVANSAKTITLGGNLTTSGAFATTLTATAVTAVTLPTGGTLLSTAAAVTVAQGGTGATTLTGVLKGNGTGAFTAAVAGTDYSVPAGTETLASKTLTTPTINGYTEGVVTANTTTSYTIALTGTVQNLTLTGNCTYTFPAAVAGKSFLLVQKQDATGSRTVTWPAAVKWPGSTAPTLTATASKADLFGFTCDGTNWYGRSMGSNFL